MIKKINIDIIKYGKIKKNIKKLEKLYKNKIKNDYVCIFNSIFLLIMNYEFFMYVLCIYLL